MILSILTPVSEFYNGEITSVSVDSTEGRLQIRPRHAPYVFPIKDCICYIETGEGKKAAAVMSGFVEVMSNKVIILSDACEWPEEIDEGRAKEAKERALNRLKDSEKARIEETRVDRERAYKSYCRAEIRLKLLLTRGGK